MLGNILNEFSTAYDYGVLGITSDSNIANTHIRLGVYHSVQNSLIFNDVVDKINVNNSSPGAGVHTGHYLVSVSTVPVPAAAWLFGSALLGFFGFSRRKANS